jgi:hypothetical protein
MGYRAIILAAIAALFVLTGEARAQGCSGQASGNQVCATPNGSAGPAGFRALVATDIPTLPPVGITVGTTTITSGTSGRIPYNNSGVYGEFVMSGDCTFTAPSITCTKTGGLTFAASATTDTTQANNITSNTLSTARLNTAAAADFRAGTASKVLVADQVFTTEVTQTQSGATLTLDFSQFLNAAVTLVANITTINFNNVKAGQAGVIRFTQSGAGSFTIPANSAAGLSSTLKCAGGCNLILTTGSATASDVLPYQCISTTYCIGGPLLKDVK